MINDQWINDPSLAGIDRSKLQFLQKLVVDSGRITEKEKMPFLLALASKAKSNSISFTTEETNKIITTLKRYSSQDEHARMDQILQMYSMFK